jgi:hypothetical protein
VGTNGFVKNDIFSRLCKKTKKILKKFILGSFFIFLHRLRRKSIFLKKLLEHVGCEGLHATFFLDFFKKKSNASKYISNKVGRYTREQKRLVHPYCTCS